ncbi:HAD family phosphatase [Bacteriovoracaceae bacterium]|nr:HAD family phosphatase [Bacteriovoracaceae bacterium]
MELIEQLEKIMFLELSTPISFSELRYKFPQINTIIWDLDGTIANSEPMHMRAIWSAIENHQGKIKTSYSFDDLCHDSIGLNDRSIFESLLNKKIISKPINFQDFLDLKIDLFHEELKSTYPNEIIDLKIQNLIKNFKENSALKQALVTNSDRKSCLNVLKKLEIDDCFDFIITLDDMKNPKPDPEGYNHIQKLLQNEWENTFIFEDSQAGLQAAQKTPANVVKVNWYN